METKTSKVIKASIKQFYGYKYSVYNNLIFSFVLDIDSIYGLWITLPGEDETRVIIKIKDTWKPRNI